MSKATTIKLILSGVIAITVVGIVISSRASGIERHKAALAKLCYPPTITRFSDYFSSSYFRWNLQGRPSNGDVTVRQAAHMESLVALGDLQRRTFVLERQRFDTHGMLQFMALVRQAYATNVLREEVVQYYSDNEGLRTITVVASPFEMGAWAEVVRVFDTTPAAPNPLGRANGGQPVRSEANQIPAAAAPRRSP